MSIWPARVSLISPSIRICKVRKLGKFTRKLLVKQEIASISSWPPKFTAPLTRSLERSMVIKGGVKAAASSLVRGGNGARSGLRERVNRRIISAAFCCRLRVRR